MVNPISDIQIKIHEEKLKLQWDMLIQNNQFQWHHDELVVRMFCLPELELGEFSPSPLFNTQISESFTHSGEVSAGVFGIGATKGESKGHETTQGVVQYFGRVHESDDKIPHYRFSIQLLHLKLQIKDGTQQFSFTWDIEDIHANTRDIQIQVQIGRSKNGLFDGEYHADRQIPLPENKRWIIREWLERVLNTVNERLRSTIYELDAILLDLEMDEDPTLVTQSELFRSYVIDIDISSSANSQKYQTLDDAFQQSNYRLLLLGNAGAGKSTMLAVFAKKIIENSLNDPNAFLPIYTPITNWRGETPILDWIMQEAQVPTRIIQEIDSGGVIFLLDGLDEIVPLDSRTHSQEEDQIYSYQIKFLEKLKEELFSHKVLITCRDEVYETLKSRNQAGIYLEGAVIIQPLADHQIKQYLSTQSKLWKVLESDNRLLDLVRTPLLLRIFAVAFKGISNQAHDLALLTGGDGAVRDEIFKVYVRQRCVHEAQKQPARFPTKHKIVEWIDKLYDILGKVAAQGRHNRKKHIEAILGNEAENFIDQMCDLHILLRTATGDIQFIHLLLEYHFA